MISIKKAVDWATFFFRDFENPRLEAEVLLAGILQEERVLFKSHSELPLYYGDVLKYFWWCLKRKCHIPVAYIMGYKKWNDFDLFVNKEVLIPRDETEVMCELLRQEERDFSPEFILDIGTGTGAIALYLSKWFPDAKITVSDISEEALKVAIKNLDFYDVDFRPLISDLLAAISHGDRYDIIVANLPYVPEDMDLMGEVRKEPALALFSGKDGLDHYRRLAKEIKEKKIQFRELWLEFFPFQQEGVARVFREYDLTFLKDLSGEVCFVKIV